MRALTGSIHRCDSEKNDDHAYHTTLAWRISLVLMVVASLISIGLAMAPQADAETKTSVSMSKRVKIQTRNCTDGGGSIEVTSTTKTNGPFVTTTSTTTTCTGGIMDGTTCVNKPKSIDCTQTFVMPTQPIHTGLPEVADPVDNPQPNDPGFPNWQIFATLVPNDPNIGFDGGDPSFDTGDLTPHPPEPTPVDADRDEATPAVSPVTEEPRD